MPGIGREEITAFVAENIEVFHQNRLDSLVKLKLLHILQRKNPYLPYYDPPPAR